MSDGSDTFPNSFGWNSHFDRALALAEEVGHEVARVSAEFRGGYLVATSVGTTRAGLSGKLRMLVKRGGSPAPAVGDWVTLEERTASDARIIRSILARTTLLRRKAAGEGMRAQTMAANVDVVFVVSSVVDDFNVRRIERYLAVAREGGVVPVVVLTKTDLVASPSDCVASIRAIDPVVPIHAVSVVQEQGLAALERHLVRGATIALLGSSGVGKSTLMNRFLGRATQEVQAVKDDGKGRHTTTHRELFALESGALLIDTPGMRELGVYEAEAAVIETFDDIDEVARRCRFSDCLHQNEPGCAVLIALESGELPRDRWSSFLKLREEAAVASPKADKEARLRAKRESKVAGRALRARLREKGHKK